SGSRGAVLDVLLVIALWSFGWWRSRTKGLTAAVGRAVGIIVLVAALGLSRRTIAQTLPNHDRIAPASAASASPTMLGRTNTVTERLHYLETGWRIFLRNPVFGSGAGAVDLYYGHYKPPEARETKYLHNWIAQVAVENG